MSLSSIQDMDPYGLILLIYNDKYELDNSISEPKFTITTNDYSQLSWDDSSTTMVKPTEQEIVDKYNSIKT